MKSGILLLLCATLFLTPKIYAQTASLRGSVISADRAVSFANIFIEKLKIGAVADEHGHYVIDNIPEGKYEVSASFIGYDKISKAIVVQGSNATLNFELTENAASFNAVVVTGTQKESTKLESAIPVEIYNPGYFRRNPTPNIFEALQMVNGVQPQINCNVCSTGDIHINGMEGPYTMVLIDGMPIVSSLSTVYGLSGIPNSMIKRIEVVKGPASTLYGSEAVGGLINIITKDAQSAPSFHADIFATTNGELNLDLSASLNFKNAATLFGVNGFWFDTKLDNNKDGFTDLTLQKRLSLFNKWSFNGKNNKQYSLAVRYLIEDRWGGQTQWTKDYKGSDSIYGETILTNRFELIGNFQFPTKENFLLEYSYNMHDQNSYYGTVKYFATQHTAFTQLRWEKKISNNSFMVGVPFRFIHYDDNTVATQHPEFTNKTLPAITMLPGIFIQHEMHFKKQFTSLLGFRYDYHNVHGSIFSPRLSLKYSPTNYHSLRLSGGNGFRVVNLFTEDHAALTGSRKVNVEELLKPEQSWNTNLNYTGFLNHLHGYVGLDASLFYNYFTNKILGDYFSDPDAIIYRNIKGYAVSRGITLNTDFVFQNGLKIRLGGTFMDVYQVTEDSAKNKIKEQQILTPKFSGIFSISYLIPKIRVTIDITGRVNAPMRLPILENDFRPEFSPWYSIVNLQLSRKFKYGIEAYCSIQNLLNFVPQNPIMRPEDPFDKHVNDNNPNGYTFDTSYNYAPLQGVRALFGLRYTLEKTQRASK
jgi:outer membrane receptor for ferrienterochelin and colicins